MSKPPFPRSQSGSKNGVALLAVLAFVLLLTILIVSYIAFTRLNSQSTASYGSAVQAQEIARGGLEDILGDLHTEIVAGSIKDPTGSTYTPTGTTSTIYVPAVNATAAPARIGYAEADYTNNPTAAGLGFLPTTLVRVSRATGNPNATGGDAFFTQLASSPYTNNIAAVAGQTILNRASLASTGTPSVNGHYISPARWNKPYLLAATTATLPTPFTNAPPDWVYVTRRSGSRVCTTTDLTAPAPNNILPSSNLTANYGPPTPGANPPASPVVGRYAFVVYNEGALLDANVAGSPSSLINNSTVVATQTSLPIYTNSPSATPPIPASVSFNGKSYLAFADLMQLPGFSGGGATSQSLIDNFVQWRNAGGIANANTSYGNGYTGTGTGYLGAIFNYVPNGFLQFQAVSMPTPISDSPLLNRQDLINYFVKIDPNFNTTSAKYSLALPYLGTFSRAVSAPSYSPPMNPQQDPNYRAALVPVGSGSQPNPIGWNQTAQSNLPAYKTNAETSGVANRDLANVRFVNAGTITHYYDDQSPTSIARTASYTVVAGDQLLQNRFSLARISWLKDQSLGGSDPNGVNPVSGNGPSMNFATAIQACFGLVWGPPGTGYSATALAISPQSNSTANGGNPCWNYVGSKAGTGATAAPFNGNIETLDQVAKEGREPNFFEVLKASILSGSLGLSPGLASYDNGQHTTSPLGYGLHDFRIQGANGFSDLLGAESLFSGTLSAKGPPAPATIPDMQIIQIGANIIDQYGADNFPTAIYFPYLSLATLPGGAKPAYDPVAGYTGNSSQIANALFGPVTMVYGLKNIPLLSKVVTVIASPQPVGALGANGVPSAANNDTTTMEGWLQPELWNPHQQANSTSNTTSPVNFEIRAYNSAYTFSSEGTGYNYAYTKEINPGAPPNQAGQLNIANASDSETYFPGVSSSESPTTSTPSGGPQAGTLIFNVDNTQFPFYMPRLLTFDNLPGVTVSTTSGYGLPSSSTNPTSYAGSGFPYYGTPHAPGGFPTSSTTYYNHFAAFSAGIDKAWYVMGPGVDPSGAHYPGNVTGGWTGVDFQATAPTLLSGVSFALGWYPAGATPTASNFHPYSFISGCFLEVPMSLANCGAAVGPKPYFPSSYPNDLVIGDVTPVNGITGVNGWGLVDPRSNRISAFNSNASETYNADDYPDAVNGYSLNEKSIPGYNSSPGAASISPNNFITPAFNSNSIGASFPQDWLTNTILGSPRINSGDTRLSLSYPYTAKTAAYYADPDGVVRPADGGAYIDYMNLHTGYVPPSLGFDLGIGLNYSSSDGSMLFLGKGSPTAATSGNDPISSTDGGVTQHGRRPVVLNRPFRSVGELGYVSRDLPFKTLDFFSTSSADAALLDVFSLTDESKISSSAMTSIVAGEVDLSNAPLPVIQSILTGSSKKETDPTYNLNKEAATTAQNCANALNPATGPNPLLNRAALVTQLQPALISAMTAVNFNTGDMANKAYLEAPVRALADVTNTRTWNLMIDIIAQSGQMSHSAKTLDDFVGEGEKRYWLHVAIDRYSGKVIAEQLEPAYE